MLSSPPAGDPGERLRWTEAAIALQLAPLAPLQECLAGIAGLADPHQLELVFDAGVPAPECQRLLAAVVWITNADCRCDANWATLQQLVVADVDSFVDGLVQWSALQHGDSARMARAEELLFEIWDWVAAGCDNKVVLRRLFAWASQAIAMRPFIEVGQTLMPVWQEVRKGTARVGRAVSGAQQTPGQLMVVEAKAWTSVLFLLDASGEPWWWLQLIRPAVRKDPPWTDGEDGGVGAAPAVATSKSPNEWEDNEVVTTPHGTKLFGGRDSNASPVGSFNGMIDEEDEEEGALRQGDEAEGSVSMLTGLLAGETGLQEEEEQNQQSTAAGGDA